MLEPLDIGFPTMLHLIVWYGHYISQLEIDLN